MITMFRTSSRRTDAFSLSRLEEDKGSSFWTDRLAERAGNGAVCRELVQ
jgi:hypothetical protein